MDGYATTGGGARLAARAGAEDSSGVTVQGKTGRASESLGRVVGLVMEGVSGGPSRWHNHGHATGGTESRYGMTTGDYGVGKGGLRSLVTFSGLFSKRRNRVGRLCDVLGGKKESTISANDIVGFSSAPPRWRHRLLGSPCLCTALPCWANNTSTSCNSSLSLYYRQSSGIYSEA